MFRPKVHACAIRVVGLVLFAAVASSAQQDSIKPTMVIHVGRLIDVRNGRVTANSYVTIGNGKIVSVGDSAPAGVPALDLSRYTVVPGLIDCHAHVLGNPKDQSSASGLRMSSAQKTIWGMHNLQIWLDHGFTASAGCRRRGYGLWAARLTRQH